MESWSSRRYHGVKASAVAAMPMMTSGPRPCNHDGLTSPIAAQIARPISGMANCRFCQKSKLMERTFTKCGWLQYSAMVAAETTDAARKAKAAMAAGNLAIPSVDVRIDQTIAAAS